MAKREYIRSILALSHSLSLSILVVLQSNFFSNCVAGAKRPQHNYIVWLPQY